MLDKKFLFESFRMENFNQIYTLTKHNEIWLKLHELYDNTSNIREQKKSLDIKSYDSFQMK
jgi:hypothetical protein